MHRGGNLNGGVSGRVGSPHRNGTYSRQQFRGNRHKDTLSSIENWKALCYSNDPVEIVLKFKKCESSARTFINGISTYDEFSVVFELLRFVTKSSYETHALSVVKLVMTTDFMNKLVVLFEGDVTAWLVRGIAPVSSFCRDIKQCCVAVSNNFKHFENDYYGEAFNTLIRVIVAFLQKLKEETARWPGGLDSGFDGLITEFEAISITDAASSEKTSTSVCFYPTSLFNGPPDVEPNITVGSYLGPEHYIKTQLGLLKEDFESRLRAGIALYLEDPKARNHDVWIYHDVTVQIGQHHEHLYKIVLSTEFLDKIEWEKSQRFLHGSMVIVSKENFNVFYVALVKDRGNIEASKKTGLAKYIHVEFLMAPPRCNPKDRYLLVEPKIFFEPYHQVMMALTSFVKNGLPIQQYLVDANTTSRLPEYLTESTEYTINQSVVKLSTGSGWPDAEAMALNDSQRSAVVSALTNELVLIQGPPGTGKTYLAFKIIEYLISNNKFESPILVVCYKNHSLDQILEGLYDRGVRLLRIGSQSKSEKVQKFNLSKVVSQGGNNVVFRQIKETENMTKENSRELNILWSSVHLLKMKRGIVHFALFKQNELISADICSSFENGERFYEWLIASHMYSEESLLFPTPDQVGAMSQLDSSPTLVYGISLDEIIKEVEALKIDHQKIVDESRKRSLTKKQHQLLLDIMFQLEKSLYNFNLLQTRLDEFDKIAIAEEAAVESILSSTSLYDIPLIDRWKIYRFWESQLLKINEENLMKAMNERFSLTETHRELKDMYKARQIEFYRPEVLGITTSGAAAHHRILEQIAPPVVIVEEAAEVLESHVVSSLSKACQHLILIGDHQQLKPSTASHVMSQQYNMNVSLFERMMMNDARSDTLNVQHRMRPEIAALICPSIYPNLVNHPSVFDYPNVPGVTKNVIFFHHTGFEELASDSESRFNRFEADFALAFCSYLTKQSEYAKNQRKITILATYKQQERYLVKGCERLGLRLTEVQITAVDNYQGEENDVIILSLVRSNYEGNIGFLATKNRICVALSRAKHGLYILGNMDCLIKNKSSIWCEISEVLEAQNAIVTEMPLKCKIHGVETRVSKVDEILALKYGGCGGKCQTTLDCGHVCSVQCHGYDIEHEHEFKCVAPCNKKCPIGHACNEFCSVECPPCPIPVPKKLPCLHIEDVPCSEVPTNEHCKQYVIVDFDECGHQLLVLCREKLTAKCKTPCESELICFHKCPRICHVDDDRFHERFLCTEKCMRFNQNCPSLHECTRLCHEDCGTCLFPVSKTLPCTHAANMECSKEIDDVLCNKACKKTLKCGHVCPNECGKPCGPCKLEVSYTRPCGHEGRKICGSVPLEGDECQEDCTRVKDCGHVCSGPCRVDCNTINCGVRFEVEIPCGHTIRVKCFRAKASVDVMLGWCRALCSHVFPDCGHSCQGSCGSCLQGRVHKGCTAVCNKQLRCSHRCDLPCGHLYHTCQKKACESICWSSSELGDRLEGMSLKNALKGRKFSFEKNAFNKMNHKFWAYFKKNSPGANNSDYIETGALADFASQVSVSASNLRMKKNDSIVPLMSHFFLIEFIVIARQIMEAASGKKQFASVENFVHALIESLVKRDLHHLTSREIHQIVVQMAFVKCCVVTPSRFWSENKSMFELWNDPEFTPKLVSDDDVIRNALFPMTRENVVAIVHHKD